MIKQLQNFAVAGILISAPLYPNTIKTPQDLGNWLEANFTYQAEKGEYWKTPEETVRDKGGDCEDFAILADYILKDLNYKSKIIIITGIIDNKFSGHAICVFKNQSGLWEHFSNTDYVNFSFSTVEELINFFYPQWKSYRECSPNKLCHQAIIK
jgi:hypothetical protein